jgi:hypothetical protein
MSTTASSTTKHTPTPWTYDSVTRQIWDEHRRTIVDMDYGDQLPGMDEANAAFIVRACNSHDQLVGALREANDLLKQNGIDLNDVAHYGSERACDIVARIHSALAAGGA